MLSRNPAGVRRIQEVFWGLVLHEENRAGFELAFGGRRPLWPELNLRGAGRRAK